MTINLMFSRSTIRNIGCTWKVGFIGAFVIQDDTHTLTVYIEFTTDDDEMKKMMMMMVYQHCMGDSGVQG